MQRCFGFEVNIYFLARVLGLWLGVSELWSYGVIGFVL